ncbi:MAG: uncharacterized membrane protein YhaH (DUF805 family) [Myxococcota bacterium]|jgi:uncharacterized membrane protein YhaH (DUF805 family)
MSDNPFAAPDETDKVPSGPNPTSLAQVLFSFRGRVPRRAVLLRGTEGPNRFGPDPT